MDIFKLKIKLYNFVQILGKKEILRLTKSITPLIRLNVKQDSSKWIIIRGQIIDDYNVACIKLTATNNPNYKIVVSTWSNTNKLYLDKISEYIDYCLLTQPPSSKLDFSVNYQSISASKGLEYAKQKGCTHAIVLRSDNFFYSPKLIEHYIMHIEQLGKLESAKKHGLKNRLVVLDHYSTKNIYYHLSDFFMLGNIDDLLVFWTLKLDSLNKPIDYRMDLLSISKYHSFAENIFYQDFASKIGFKLKFTRESYNQFITNFFYIINSDDIKWKWLRRIVSFDFPRKKRSSKEYFTNVEWYNLFYSVELIEDKKIESASLTSFSDYKY